MISNKGLEYKIEKIDHKTAKVTFIHTGWTYVTRLSHALNGAVRDPMDRYKYGVGFSGFGPFKVRHPAFNVWKNMFNRVYDPIKFPDYYGCSICSDWHNYQKFASWYAENHPNKEGYEMDKDLLVPGNKVYGPETCCIIPQEINQSIVTVKSGRFPSTKQYRNKFRASVSMGRKGKIVYKYFSNREDAIDFYIQNKDIRISNLADEYKEVLNPNVIEALLNWSTRDRVDIAMNFILNPA